MSGHPRACALVICFLVAFALFHMTTEQWVHLDSEELLSLFLCSSPWYYNQGPIII